MAKTTEQLIEKVDKMILKVVKCHFERIEKSVPFRSLRFLNRIRRGGLRNDKSKKVNSSVIAVKYYLFSFFLSMVLLFLAGCANQLPPGGGEVDKIPPEIISSYPENETINYDKDFIELEFSEYVDKRSFKDALFISPAIDEQLEISWSGTSVEIIFPNGLKDSLTYVVTIGTDVVDVNNKNRMADAYTFSFATGDKIDKRSIDGKVYGNDIEGTLIFAYRFSDDTTKYLSKKPDYLSQIGKDGSYKLNGLAESVYRVFAVNDQYRDFLFQADQDEIGMPNQNISLIGNDTTFNGMDFYLMKIDTLMPRILSSVMTDINHIVVALSEECDSLTHLAMNFEIVDSTANTNFPVEYSYQGRSKKDEFILSFKNQLNKENIYYLSAKELKDLNGNVFNTELSSLVVSDKPDTISPKLFRTNPNRKSSTDFKNPEILFYFDDAIADKEIKNAIQFSDTMKNKIAFNINFIDDATLSIKPEKDLKPESVYEIKLDFSKFHDAAGNKVDSIYTLQFSTITGVEFTGLSGKVITSKENVIVVLQDPKNSKKFYTAVPDKTSTYNFERIVAGTYSLWVYSDSDSSKTFSKGYPEPFKYAEDFYFVKDTLVLRPRWSVTDLDILFK